MNTAKAAFELLRETVFPGVFAGRAHAVGAARPARGPGGQEERGGDDLVIRAMTAMRRLAPVTRRRIRGFLAGIIDHTLLRPEATARDIDRLCAEALANRFCAACVNPAWVGLCARLLAGSKVKLCSVAGFPLGATSSEAKAAEARFAVAGGAQEVDMVLNIGALRGGDLALVEKDIAAVVRAVSGKALVKVIMETALLTREEKIAACRAVVRAGADFVKTSTGFSSGGATVEDVELLAANVPPTTGVKASGGIRNLETAFRMVLAGATRIGTSAGPAILKELD